MAITFIPFLARVIASYSPNGNTNIAMEPSVLLLIFGFVLNNETSHTWLALSIFVRGTNSVGSHVWCDGALTDYPRILLLILLILASVASPLTPVRDGLTISGAVLGCILLLCNLGSRAWKKADLGFVDSSNFFTPYLAILASLLAGITFPYMGLRSVDGGTGDNDGNTDVEKVIFRPNGKRARQAVTMASSAAALVYLLSDAQQVQEALGFDFSTHRGILNLAMGGWLFMSTLISMSLCHRLDSSRSKKIEPFLRRDETSPVGWVVPSIPHIVIDPNLSRGKMYLPFLSFGSDIICSVVVAGYAFLIIWMGVREIQGHESSAFWGLT